MALLPFGERAAARPQGNTTPQKIRIVLVGDSTVTEDSGWGAGFRILAGSGVEVVNLAANGRSSKSYLDEGRWKEAIGRRGHYYLIQFGHNDEPGKGPERETDPETTFRANISRYVDEARAAGATPVLFSSIVRRQFNATGVLVDTHGVYPWVARAVARETGAPFVDLQLLTEELVIRAGPEGSKRLYIWVEAGQYPAFPQARQDDTHLSPAGASEVARLAARELRRLGGALAAHVTGVE